MTSAILNCSRFSGSDSDAVGNVSAAEEVEDGVALLELLATELLEEEVLLQVEEVEVGVHVVDVDVVLGGGLQVDVDDHEEVVGDGEGLGLGLGSPEPNCHDP